jgi:hypothetical protein
VREPAGAAGHHRLNRLRRFPIPWSSGGLPNITKDAQTSLKHQGLAKSEAASSFGLPLLRALTPITPLFATLTKKSGVEGTWRRKPSMKILSPPESVSIRLALSNEGGQRRDEHRDGEVSLGRYSLLTIHYNIRSPNSSTTMDG